jgi:tetratricopeptide (TPR) repeat protein
VTRHWIVPDKIYAYTNGTQIYIINASLTVNSEPVANHSSFQVYHQENRTLSKACLEELNKSAKDFGKYNKELEDRMIQPYVIADVNQGEKYEDLRDVYVSLTLAQWYKSKITSRMDIFRESLDSSNSTMLRSTEPWSPNEIWGKYVYSFENGEYKCWENETTKTAKGTVTKSSSSSLGGVDFGNIRANLVEIDELPLEIQDQVKKVVTYGFLNKGKNVFFGSRLHVNLRPDTPVSSSNSHADPNLATTWYNKGVTFQGQDKLDDAIEAYDEAISRDPNLAEAWNNKGSALNKQGKYEEALKAFDEAIRLTSEANAPKARQDSEDIVD